jgi:hypothetical protein
MNVTVAAGATDTGYAGTNRPVIQNLGPGDLFVGNVSSTLLTEGIKLVPNAVYEFPENVVEGPGKIFMQASGATCDVRILNIG